MTQKKTPTWKEKNWLYDHWPCNRYDCLNEFVLLMLMLIPIVKVRNEWHRGKVTWQQSGWIGSKTSTATNKNHTHINNMIGKWYTSICKLVLENGTYGIVCDAANSRALSLPHSHAHIYKHAKAKKQTVYNKIHIIWCACETKMREFGVTV